VGSCPKSRTVSLTPELLLDTHIILRWISEPKKLSQEQMRAIRAALRRGEHLGLSAVSLLEISSLYRKGIRSRSSLLEVFKAIDAEAGFHVVPIDVDTAIEVAALADVLRDPADAAIVATARVHRLRLVTSDQRIIDSKLVSVIE
jgi:PIN domain nuclease of toxin-antitoxin system